MVTIDIKAISVNSLFNLYIAAKRAKEYDLQSDCLTEICKRGELDHFKARFCR